MIDEALARRQINADRCADFREARIYSARFVIAWAERSAALLCLQISRYLLQKPPWQAHPNPGATIPRE